MYTGLSLPVWFNRSLTALLSKQLTQTFNFSFKSGNQVSILLMLLPLLLTIFIVPFEEFLLIPLPVFFF